MTHSGQVEANAQDATKPTGANRFAELDGLRGLAIIMVLVWHYIGGQVQVEVATPGAYALRMVSFAWTGVDIFFVLSGYLVGGMLVRNRASGLGPLPILFRRCFRILPLYLLSLGTFLAVRAASDQEASGGLGWLIDGPLPIWSYATMTQNFAMAKFGTHGAEWLGISWSLAVEMQFYLLLAALVTFVRPERLLLAATVFVLVCWLSRIALVFAFGDASGFASFLLPLTRMDSVCLGLIVSLVPCKSALGGHREKLVDAGIAACFIVVVALCAAGQGIGSAGMNLIGHLLIGVASTLLIFRLTSNPDGSLQQLFRHPFLLVSGTYSYGLYLLHQPVAGLVHHFALGQVPRIVNAQDLGATALALLITLILVWLSWHKFESPFIKLGHRLTR